MRHASLLGLGVVLFLSGQAVGCGIRGYHWAGGTGDVTHAIEPGARVVFPNAKKEVPYAGSAKTESVYMMGRGAPSGPNRTSANLKRFKGECDDSLWDHVYNHQRLEIHRCVAVTGTFVDATAGRASRKYRKTSGCSSAKISCKRS